MLLQAISIQIEEIIANSFLSHVTGRKMDAPDFSKTEDFKGVTCVFFRSDNHLYSVYEYRP